MFGIFLSALNAVLGSALGLVFRTVVVKFVFFTALYLIATEFISVIQAAGILPTAQQVQAGFSSIPPSIAYIAGVFNLYWGASAVFSAYATRFIISL